MKIGPFIQHVAQATHVAEATVKIIARFLREAGYLTTTPTKARGVNGPEMVPRDAARLLLALLVTTSPARAVEAYKEVSCMIPFLGNVADAAERITAAGFPCTNGETVEESLTALMTPTTEVKDELTLVMKARGGEVTGLTAMTGPPHATALMFRPDYSKLLPDALATLRRMRNVGPEDEDVERWCEGAGQELAARGSRPWLYPGGFMDERSIGANALLWLRWKAFEEG